ncbi:MAG: UvrD-helicase domain-containing protein [Acidobacteria bacterium]|nr:UvrD-helicase domain-containing protein [Acidobacteriota bacterium]
MSAQTPIVLPDAAARREAITTPHHAFVWASAGTGKTHTLTLRALYLLLNAPFLSPGEGKTRDFMAEVVCLYSTSSRRERLRAARAIIASLVMTTFTRKAAAEMQTRLYRYLESVTAAESLSQLQATSVASPNELEDPLFYEVIQTVLNRLESGSAVDGKEAYQRLRAGAQALAEQAAQLQISTIHSFAASILRRHPLQAGIPPTARFAREGEDDLVGVDDQLVERWWQQRVLVDSQLEEQLAKLLQVLPVSQIQDWLKQSYHFPWMSEETDSLPLHDQKEMQDLIAAGHALVGALEKGGGSKIEKRRDQLDRILQSISAGEQGAWRQLCGFIQQVRDYFFLDQKITKTVRSALTGLPPEHSRYFQSWTSFYIPAARICLAQEFGQTWAVWTQFLGSFVGWAQEAVIRELGIITFDDMIRLAVRLLENHPSLRQAEQGKLQALLVDEFQDTDPDQLRLFKALLKRDSHSGHEVLGFFVGDTKQSIYRFRKADVLSIEDFRRHYETYTRCQLKRSEFHLKTSFRSVKAVTQFVNHFFENELALTDEEDELVPFRSEERALPEWILIDTDGEGKSFKTDKARDYAAAQTLLIIQEYLKSSDSPEPPYKDFLVLVRDWREVDALLPVLQNAGIPVISSGAKTFFRQPEVLDLLNLLIALLHPQDKLAVAAILRSPLLCLADPQLHDLLKQIPPGQLLHSQKPLPKFLPHQVRTRIEQLRQLAAERLKKTLSEWLQEVSAFIPTALYSEPGDREGRPFVRIERVLKDFKEEMERTLIPPLVWLLKQRARAAEASWWGGNPGEDITVADESVNAVRVMTIHKAKGLEGRFTIVYAWSSVLSHLAKRPGRGSLPQVLSLTNGKGQRLQAFSLRWGPLQLFSSSYIEALQEEREGDHAETKRLAYVAATRACDRLVLLCPTSKGTSFPQEIQDIIDSAKKRLPADSQTGEVDSCNGRLRFVRRPGFEAIPSTAPLPSLNWSRDHYKSLWENRYSEFKAPRPPLLCHPSDPEHRQEEEHREDHHYLREGDRETRLLAGTLVHIYLERYLLHDAFEPVQLSALLRGLPVLTLDSKALESAEGVLRKFFAGALVDTSGRAFLERVRAARILGREVPVYLLDEGQAWNGVIDLVLEEEGIIRAVDYKTTTAKASLPKAYAQQERIYSEALRRLFPQQSVAFEFWWMGES